MKVTVLAAGSRGDIQPYLALAVGLQAAGHQVLFAANGNFADLAGSYDLPFHPFSVDSFAFLQNDQAQAWLASRSPLRLALNSARVVRPTLEPMLRDAWQACQEADAIIYHAYTMPTGYLIGRVLGLPCLPASMYPVPTAAHPALPVDISLPRRLNRFSHWLVDQFTWLIYRGAARRFFGRRTAVPWRSPFQQLRREKRTIVCCYSPTVLPAPADLPDHVHLTGYWFLEPPAGWQPAADLRTFLDAGPPPVYIGFGSMGDPAQARATTALVLDALAQTGRRGLLAAGWSGLGDGQALPDTVFALKEAPHTWLLPQMAAIVHHGGVGTTGAGLRAGVPNIVVPHFGDQPFWGRRVAALGAGPAPIHRRDLTAERLAAAIDAALNDSAMRARAAAVGRQLGVETGVGQARIIFERFVADADGGGRP